MANELQRIQVYQVRTAKVDSLNYIGDVKAMFRMKKIKIPFIQLELAVWRNAARHQRQIIKILFTSD